MPPPGTRYEGGMLVDSHCHLNYPGLVEQQDAVIDRARTAGVTGMLNISTRQREWGDICALAQRHDDIWASIGIHPHEADDHAHIQADDLIAAAQAPEVVGIGETGLDYFYDHSDRDRQKDNFRHHITASRTTGLPLIVHVRNAEDDTHAMLADEMRVGPFPGVIHCFTASRDFAEKMLDLGFYISLSGIVTFKNARDLQETAQYIPEDRLLIETDAPFLAPTPMRGKTCEPAFVAHTAQFIAALRGVDVAHLCDRTARNFHRLFAKTPCAKTDNVG